MANGRSTGAQVYRGAKLNGIHHECTVFQVTFCVGKVVMDDLLRECCIWLFALCLNIAWSGVVLLALTTQALCSILNRFVTKLSHLHFISSSSTDPTGITENMTIKATKFTPEVMLSAPRRSVGSPSPDGKRALFTVSSYSFETHKKTAQIRVLDIESGQSRVLVEDVSSSEPIWLSNDEFLYLKGGEKGSTTILVDSVSQPGAAR